MKNELRQQYLKIRQEVKNKDIKNQVIYNKVIKNKDINKAKTILIYVSKRDEVDTLKLIIYFLNTFLVAVPKVENNIINFYYINSLNDLKVGSFNILEPISNKKVTNFKECVIIVPGICFTKNKNRIGYGKGFYDKFLFSHVIYSIGLCYRECLLNDEPLNTFTIFDKKLDEVITN